MTSKKIETAIALRSLAPDQREKIRCRLLREHIDTAAQSPYYRHLFAEHGLDSSLIHTLEDIRRFPLTDRRALDVEGSGFQAVPDHDIADISLTSGTTGPAVKVVYTREDIRRLAMNEALAFWGVGARPGARYQICVTLDRCFIAGLAYYTGLIDLGVTAIRSGPGQPARQWELIHSLSPTGLVGVPTFLLQIGEWARTQGFSPAKAGITTLVTIGEPIRRPDFSLTPLGEALTELWGAEIYASYGATELETGICECGQGQGGHVHPELMIAEIVDEEGNVLPDGQPGELVVTPLGVRGFPLLRFRTGDVARKYSDPCPCGWSTERIGPIEGRLSQRLKFRGTTIYPETIFQVLQEIAAVRNAYIEVRSAYDLADEITVVVGCGQEVKPEAISALLQARLRASPRVQITSPEKVLEKMARHGGRKPQKFFDYR